MLVVWVFALLSGMAHACGLGAGGMHGAGALAAQAAPAGHEHCTGVGHGGHDVAAVADQVATPDAALRDDAPPPGHTPCAKFCEDSSAGVPTVKQPFDPRFDVAPAPIMPVVVASLRLEADPAALAARATPPPRGVPIAIAYLRLTR